MNAEHSIRELVKTFLEDTHNVRGVEFIDQLLPVASETGTITCTLASEHKLRFQIPGLPPWEVELERAKAKLRMLCARLGVLCNENGREVFLYGGEGVAAHALATASTSTAQNAATASAWHTSSDGSASANSTRSSWRVSFKNTPSEQEFIIQAQ